MPKLKNSNETFWAIFKQREYLKIDKIAVVESNLNFWQKNSFESSMNFIQKSARACVIEMTKLCSKGM